MEEKQKTLSATGFSGKYLVASFLSFRGYYCLPAIWDGLLLNCLAR